MKYIRTNITRILVGISILGLVPLLRADVPHVPSGTWSATGDMSQARAGAAATLMRDGRVLVTGGLDATGAASATSERYSPDGGQFVQTAPMSTPRTAHTSTLLPDGRVLVAGGVGADGIALSTIEIYDPATNAWTTGAALNTARSGHTATSLSDGRIVIAGGEDRGVAIESIELYDPQVGVFTLSAASIGARTDHAAALLDDGKILVTGGVSGTTLLSSTAVYDPATDAIIAGPALATARAGHSATTLISGKVLVAGGAGASGDLTSVEIYDPSANSFASAGSLIAARQRHLAVLLPHNNQVLIVGGTTGDNAVTTAELYVPWQAGGTFVAANPPATPARAWAAAAALSFNANETVRSGPNDGLLLLAGGSAHADATAPTKSADLYGFATVKTDKADYAPGQKVTIRGTGWQPGETVTLTLLEEPFLDTHAIQPVVADGAGNIFSDEFIPDAADLGIKFYLTATRGQSQAQTVFADAGFDAELQGKCKSTALPSCGTAANPWVSGNLKGWGELENIPMRVALTNGPVSGQVIAVDFDHTQSGKPGIQNLTNFVPSAGVTITAGPTLTTPAGDKWTYTFTINLTTAAGDVSFFGRMAAGAHIVTGGSLQLGGSPSLGALQITKPSPAPGSPDLLLTKAGPTSAAPGDTLTYTLNFQNKLGAASTATGVQLSDTLPGLVSYVAGTCSGACTVAGNTISWDLGSLSPNTSGSRTYQVTVSGSATYGATFTNAASILSAENDATPADNNSSVTTTVSFNRSPVAVNDSYSTNEDTPLTVAAPAGVLSNDTDADSNPLTAALVTGPSHGTLTLNADGSFTYTPAADYSGPDSFTYKANDGTVDSSAATVSIAINAVNDTPTAANQSVTTNENTAKAITLTGDDGDAGVTQTLTFAVGTGPTHGTLSGFNAATGAVTYTPAAGYNGADSFTFTVTDDTTAGGAALTSAPATVSITVSAVNDPPTAADQSVTTNEDTAKAITLSGDDGDAGVTQTLTFAIGTGPSHGTLSGFDAATGAVTYTPAAGYNGADSFTFTVTDDTTAGGAALTSAPATVSITVTPVNDPPTASAQSVTTNEDTAKAITLSGDDGDAGVTQTLTFAVGTGPSHGTLSGFDAATGAVTYTPAAGYNGADSFTFTVTDDTTAGGAALTSAAATVSITVSAVNDPPTAADQSVTTNEDTAKAITLSGDDGDAGVTQTLTFAIGTGPSHGTLSGFDAATGAVTYTPAAGYNGADSFTFTVTDDTTAGGAALTSAPATVSITVSAVNDPPTAADQSVTTNEDTAKAITLSGDDGDTGVTQTLTFAIGTGPSHGTLSGFDAATGAVTYTPAANYNGADSFTFTVTDDTTAGGAALTSAPATVSITVSAVNDPPTASAQSVTTNEDTAKAITLSGDDGDPYVTQTLTFAIGTGPSHGTLSGFNAATGAVTYTPATNYNGADSFTFTMTDDTTAGGAALTSAPATVSITVSAVNDPPTAADQSVTTNEDTAKAITLSGDDGDAGVTQTLTFAIGTGPSHGTLSGFDAATGAVTYTPAANYNGADSFTFTVTDDTTAGGAALTSAAATVSITVTPVNDPPTASAQSVTTNEDTAKAITLTGNDGDPYVTQTLTFAIASNPSHGTLSGFDAATGAVTYTPAANYNGADSFTFTVTDDTTAGGAALTSAAATVSITVTPVNDPPTASAQSVTTNEDTAKAITLSGDDGDAGVTQTLTFAIGTGPSHGTLSGFNAATGAVTYTPTTNYNGADSFTFTVTDDTTAGGAALTSAPATVSITVSAVNDPPTAADQSVTTNEDTAKAITLTGNDGDPYVTQTLTFAIGTGPSHGTLSGFDAATGAVTYTPATNYNGADSFTFTVTDDTTAGGAALTSAPATVSITVSAVNDPPTAADQSVTTNEDTAKAITLSGDDGDAGVTQTLTFAVGTGPSHGTLSGFDAATGAVTYTPAANYNGADSFTFTVTDDTTAGGAALTSAPATVSITVSAVNDAPTASAQSVTTNEDTAKAITLSGDDGDPYVTQTLTFAIGTGPSHGTLSGFNAATGALTYTPATNYNGADSFTFTVTDDTTAGGAALTSAPATVSITVSAVNDPPTAADQSVTTNEDTAKAITLTGNDGDPYVTQTLTFAIGTGPGHGTLSGFNATTGTVTYTPALDYNGADSFTFTVTDDTTAGGAALTSAPGTVSITVTPVNDAPVPTTPNTPTVQYSDSIPTVTITATDVDSPASSLTAAPPTPMQWKKSTDLLFVSTQPLGGLSLTPLDPTANPRQWTLTGRALVGEGTYIVRVGISDGAATGYVDVNITVTKENTTIEYSGDTLKSTGSTGTASMNLAAVITEQGDGELGNKLSTTQIKFTVYKFTDTAMTTPVANCTGSVTATVAGSGTAACAVSLGEDNYTVKVELLPNQYYTAPCENEAITVVVPGTGMTTGGGWLNEPTLGSRSNFGFTVKYLKNGNIQGNSLYIYRKTVAANTVANPAGGFLPAGEYNWIIKSNAMVGMTQNCTGTVPTVICTATFTGKNNIIAVNRTTGVAYSLGGNNNFQVDVSDKSEPGSSPGAGPDSYALRVWDTSTGTYYQLGTPAAQLLIVGGNIQVKLKP